ncbi:MAG: DUF4258 domain-containing protein [Chromatiales bacterium]
MATGRFDFSRHAFKRAVERNISEQEIRTAGARAEIIEEYPEDKYSPSVLLLGFTSAGRLCIFRYRRPTRTRQESLHYTSRTRPSGPSFENGGSHVNV